jgi:hypothetical protein
MVVAAGQAYVAISDARSSQIDRFRDDDDL